MGGKMCDKEQLCIVKCNHSLISESTSVSTLEEDEEA